MTNIARCPEHGLHGEREECFVCAGPVEQIAMVEIAALAPGREWCNVHTGRRTVIGDLGIEPERGIGRDGSVRVPATAVVFHTANTPPGFQRGSGQALASFVAHWRPS